MTRVGEHLQHHNENLNVHSSGVMHAVNVALHTLLPSYITKKGRFTGEIVDPKIRNSITRWAKVADSTMTAGYAVMPFNFPIGALVLGAGAVTKNRVEARAIRHQP